MKNIDWKETWNYSLMEILQEAKSGKSKKLNDFLD